MAALAWHTCSSVSVDLSYLRLKFMKLVLWFDAKCNITVTVFYSNNVIVSKPDLPSDEFTKLYSSAHPLCFPTLFRRRRHNRFWHCAAVASWSRTPRYPPMVTQLKHNQNEASKGICAIFQQFLGCYRVGLWLASSVCTSFTSRIKCHCVRERFPVQAMPEALWMSCSVQ